MVRLGVNGSKNSEPMISSQPVVSSHLTQCMRISLTRAPAIVEGRNGRNANQPIEGLTQ